MRTAILLAMTFLAMTFLGGCSVLDQLALNDGPTLDPSRIYLQGNESVNVRKRDIGDYACVNTPLICHGRGLDFECRCSAW